MAGQGSEARPVRPEYLAGQLPNLTGIRRTRKLPMRLDAATATAARPAGAIMGNRSHVLDSSYPDTLTSQHPNRGLRTRTRSPGLVAARSPNTNMERSNP